MNTTLSRQKKITAKSQRGRCRKSRPALTGEQLIRLVAHLIERLGR